MSGPRYKWQEAFDAALLAEDSENEKVLIARAELEMFKRYQELARNPGNAEERAELDRATMKLRFLQAQRFEFPDVTPL